MTLRIVLIVTFLATLAKARDLSQNTPNNNIQNSKIVGGQEAQPHSHPHLVGLYTESGNFCGGSIINKNTILTAAHCVDKAKTIEVVAGAHNIYNNEASQQTQFSNNFTKHAEYVEATRENDIAIIYLRTALNLTEYVKTINFDEGNCTNRKLDGTEGTTAGWGITSDSGPGGISPVLREVKNPILSTDGCDALIPGITDFYICLDGAGGKGACIGDSGGALLNENKIVGVQSFVSSFGCEKGYPTVYTRVSCFKDWIRSNLPKEFIN